MISSEVLIIAVISFIVIDLIIILMIFISKSMAKSSYSKSSEFRIKISNYYQTGKKEKTSQKQLKPTRRFIIEYCQFYDEIQVDEKMHEDMQQLLINTGWIDRFKKALSSCSETRRIEAARVLRVFKTDDGVKCLIEAFAGEKKYHIKTALLFSLVSLDVHDILDKIIDSLDSAPEWYIKKTLRIIEPLCYNWRSWAENYTGEVSNAVCLQLTVAKTAPSNKLKEICIEKIKNSDGMILDYAIEAMEENFPLAFLDEKLYLAENLKVRKSAMMVYGQTTDEFDASQLSVFFNNEDLFDTAVAVLQNIVSRYPEKLEEVYEEFLSTTDDKSASGYAAVLSERIKYYLIQLDDENAAELETLCEFLVKNNRTSLLIDFLNKNKNRTIEDNFFPLFSRLIEKYSDFEIDAVLYLNMDLKKRWKLLKKEPIYSREKIPLKKRDLLYLVLILIIGLSIYPCIYFIINGINFSELFTVNSIKNYVFNYNYYFAYYSAALNILYSVLLIFSSFNILKQANHWAAEDYRFLYTPGVLPSMTIIAPAYNEEKNIVESIISLMNIKYPDYEVIVVNDGSSDQTTQQLIKFYDLKKVDDLKPGDLKTAPIKGIYKNPDYPTLTLIDKENGGKADALNAGINFAGCEFICSIDSDSLLEPESLLKIMHPHTFSDIEIVAIGGNIIPVNGCSIEHGYLVSIGLPENSYAQYQTIEYLRSFLAGRMGWSAINSLLIISGAFGVFSRKRVIEVGGYMTGKGRFKKETVGEDMEMVVRLRRHMAEIKAPHKVAFSYNANCWTEVPEDGRSLMKQRDRWHRGLIEIMTYYKDMFANPRYGKTGLIAFVYFYIFELVGPFLEAGGYIFIILSAVLGILNFEVAMLLFVTVILYGVFISMFSLMLSEKNVLFFSKRELLRLIFRAIIENLGYRQILSFSRAVFYISFLFNKNKGWQKLNRKGFTQRK